METNGFTELMENTGGKLVLIMCNAVKGILCLLEKCGLMSLDDVYAELSWGVMLYQSTTERSIEKDIK